MKRFIDSYLLEWKQSKIRKSLLLRGARQVGKTHAVRELGKTYPNFVEINLEKLEDARAAFNGNLDPYEIITKLKTVIQQPIDPETTLLFFDEIQAVPKAIIALRYFYEIMPQLHVIAAGSLLDFAIQQVGVPVGRVEFLYMYPMSFIEFLHATGHGFNAQQIMTQTPDKPFSPTIHKIFLELVGRYILTGGMPEVVYQWSINKDPLISAKLQSAIIDTYKNDFPKYSNKFQLPYVSEVFNKAPYQFGQKFKFSKIGQEYRKRELEPCLNLLETAGILHKVMHSDGNGIPLGAEADPHSYKILFLDIALSQKILGADISNWLLNPLEEFVNKGELVEAFVGQEMLAYAAPYMSTQLYYWQRDTRGSEAEVDYLFQQQEQIIPIEVKSGSGSTLKSMHMFLESHPKSPYGIRFSTQNYSIHDKIHSYPLYAIAKALQKNLPVL